MPGQTACFRCGSVLDSSAVGGDVRPPRAPKWKMPLRRVHYWLRRRTSLSKIEDAADKAVAKASMATGDGTDLLGMARRYRGSSPWGDVRRLLGRTAGWIVVSSIPGLAHLIQKRFLTIFQLWFSWLASLATGLFLFGGAMGAISLGMAVVIHAWIAADAARLVQRIRRVLPRLIFGVGAAVVWVCIVYWGARVTLLRSILGGKSIVAVPQREVEMGDYLLCRRYNEDSPPPRRGDLLLIRFAGGRGVTQAIGLPGETVRVVNQRFVVDGAPLDPKQYPVMDWRQDRQLDLRAPGRLGEGEYFVRMRYIVEMRGRGYRRRVGFAERGHVARRDDILGRAFMRWLPLRRRGRLDN